MVELTSFTISVAILNLSQPTAKVRGRRITLSGVTTSLTAAAAGVLNQAFATQAFTEGLVLGTATVAARVR